MRHRKAGATLSRTASARRALARQLALSLLLHGRVRTSRARGRFLQTTIEPLVTAAKTGDLAARRRAMAALGGHRTAVVSLLQRAEAYRTRPGGYTRLTRLPYRRRGDATSLVLVEWV